MAAPESAAITFKSIANRVGVLGKN
jgi:hypothetical protein